MEYSPKCSIKKMKNIFKICLLAVVVTAILGAIGGEPVPARLLGAWKITRILPTSSIACWDDTRARALVGSTLIYHAHSIHWRGGDAKVEDAFMRQVSSEQFLQENGGSGGAARFEQLGIKTGSVTEVDLQHEDADITGATTEVPGDTVLLAAPNRIVISACHVYFEATR